MQRLEVILSQAHARFTDDPSPATIDWLAKELGSSFEEASFAGEVSQFREICRAHPLADVILLDPYSRRAVDKPRGYAGDAVMLDYIYRPSADALDATASAIHRATTTLPNAKSILWRRDYLAGLIHDYMGAVDRPDVLSVASGHMRELDTLRELTSSTKVGFTALDQDASSIGEAQSAYPEFAIEGKVGSFASLLRERRPAARYDLIYSAGLFDYLPPEPAAALIKAMFARLKPGGMLSVGNFTSDSHGRGFMAGFMDWRLLYRDESDMRSLASAACPTASYRIFRDQPRNVVYLEIYAD